jgi:hypothetical protein
MQSGYDILRQLERMVFRDESAGKKKKKIRSERRDK